MKICHLTSVHSRYDTRIFLKECRSLANNGYIVSLVVADGNGDEVIEGVNIYDVGYPAGRLERILKTTRLVFKRAKLQNAEIYHLHDPELIPAGLKLKKLGKKVIFDAHEDVPKQMLGKPYLNQHLRWFIAKTFAIYERWACAKLDGIITATPFIRDKFLSINSKTIDINNFPLLGELASAFEIDWSKKQKQLIYVGVISSPRGIKEMVQAMALVQSGARLQLGGCFSEKNVEAEVKTYAGWEAVDEMGWLDREGVCAVLNRSVVGLVTLHPIINYIDALPVKMFEYMSAGIPVIASHFPLWREIIEGNLCGLCVDPLDSQSIADAIDYLVTHPAEAKQMGLNGQQAVHAQYNWSIEEIKLFKFYQLL